MAVDRDAASGDEFLARLQIALHEESSVKDAVERVDREMKSSSPLEEGGVPLSTDAPTTSVAYPHKSESGADLASPATGRGSIRKDGLPPDSSYPPGSVGAWMWDGLRKFLEKHDC